MNFNFTPDYITFEGNLSVNPDNRKITLHFQFFSDRFSGESSIVLDTDENIDLYKFVDSVIEKRLS